MEHSAQIQPGDRVLLEGSTATKAIIRELFIQILEKGGHPHPLIALPGAMPFGQEELYMAHVSHHQ